jgi:hypothetical protein
MDYSFRSLRAINQQGQYFVSFLPSAQKRKGRLEAQRNNGGALAEKYNARLECWIIYYGKLYTELIRLFARFSQRFTICETKKYKRYRTH